ncbi:LPXTG cell wall anchor domain-containing protein [Petralouisia muris]|jgi:LPXTG-motif cell wall-anchored protein|uniref:LPXTG cell wall anchor domain-containing protein n=1 Tax=Petralouisia muris TaxID=3032872 RepID=A0AC61RVM2_9FIRM|nr:LPXTG cell wall anchor domain-containing protein [Petralouisia muris]TGY95870.1 LPXTG cell wall anchor domain-containing protein [Petralouisia muris]
MPGSKENEPQKPAVSGIGGNEPKTGENSHTEWYVAIFLLAGAAYLLLGRFCRREEKGIDGK